MPGARSRACGRRRRFEAVLREAVAKARSDDAKAAETRVPTPGHGELWRLFCDIARSGRRVWDVARAVGCTEDEIAMIAQAVAPRLAGMTPGSVFRRHKLAK